MDLLRENLFADSALDRNEGPERFRTVHPLRQAPPARLDAACGRIIVRARNTPAYLGDFVKLDGKSDLNAPTEGVVFLHKGEISVLLRMQPGPEGLGRSLLPAREEVRPAVWIYMDFAHGHYKGVSFHLPLYGKPSARRMWSCDGPTAGDYQRGEGRRKLSGGWRCRSRLFGRVWHMLFSVQPERFGLKDVARQPVAGFQIMRLQSVFNHVEESCWSPSRVWRPGPSSSGELALAPSDIDVRSINLARPIHGMNRAALEIANLSGRELALVCRSITAAPSLKAEHRVAARVPPRGTARVLVPYETSIHDWTGQLVTFAIETPSGAPLYRATYRAGSCYSVHFGASTLQLHHRLPYNVPRGRPAPDPSDPEFYLKKRLHILSNMPDFDRDPQDPLGAVVGRVNGKTVVRFDLKRTGALRRIGRYLEGLFGSDDDRILAATFFVHQTGTWSNSMGALKFNANAITRLRCNYIQCGDFVVILQGLLASMRSKRTGKPFTAHYTGGKNHVICAVGQGNDHTLVDPNLGFFFPSRDNTRLATIGELYRQPDLVRRVVPGRAGDYSEMPEKWFFSLTMHNFPARMAAR